MSVPVIVLNWNGWDDTFDCLRSLVTANDITEVWLVDNASKIDRLQEAKDILPRLRTFRWNDNYGWSGGYNRALKIALDEGHRFAYLLNNDCAVDPDFLTRVIETITSDETIGAVGSLTCDETSIVFDGQFPASQQSKSFDKRHVESESVHGAGMLIRLRAVESEGFFNELFFCYHEETEWCHRVRRAGWRVVTDRHSIVIHGGAKSDISDNRLYYRARNTFLLRELDTLARPLTSSIEWWRLHRKLFFSLILRANIYRKQGLQGASLALLAAAEDALCKRYGKRTRYQPSVWARILGYAQPFPVGSLTGLKQRLWR